MRDDKAGSSGEAVVEWAGREVTSDAAHHFGAAAMNDDTRADLLARFWKYVHKTPTCWLWTGWNAPGHSGAYSRFKVGGKTTGAYRVAYELFIGPIPPGMTIDHVKARGCTSTLCVRPSHLEAVDNRTNILRGDSFSAVNSRKKSCLRGHLFDKANTLHRTCGPKKTPNRECRTCRLMHSDARTAIRSLRRAKARAIRTKARAALAAKGNA